MGKEDVTKGLQLLKALKVMLGFFFLPTCVEQNKGMKLSFILLQLSTSKCSLCYL